MADKLPVELPPPEGEVKGTWGLQAGKALVFAACPKCGIHFALSGYGFDDQGVYRDKHMCRVCFCWQRVRAEGERPADLW